MVQLVQHRLDPTSRMARLALAEHGVDVDLVDASPWLRDLALTGIDPAAQMPVLLEEGLPPVIGPLAVLHIIEEKFAPSMQMSLIPHDVAGKVECWRLLDWVMTKFNDEVTRYVLEEKIGKRELKTGTPDPSTLRAAKANLSEHLHYFTYLFATRKWLCGEDLSLADFALAAHLSALDYLGDMPWDDFPEVKIWFARLKSRPAFRPLLGDRVVGMPASASYADLDF